MSRTATVSLLLLASLLVLVCETASAVPRWRRARTNYYTYSSGFVQVAAKSDDKTFDYRSVAVYCDYDVALGDEYALSDKIRVAMNIWDEEILASDEPLVAEVTLTNTSNNETSYVRRAAVTRSQVADEEYQLGTFELANSEGEEPIISPATVYRLFITLHRQSDKLNQETAFGQLPGPYYVVTSGDSRLARGRQRIVMRTFREWYYTERGWNRNATYPMDCHAYYCWATGACTVGSHNGWTSPGALFGTYHSGGHIAELMETDRIHGDYVRVPGHTFMLLSYDAEMGHVLTMEANFNHTIEICIRSVGSGWTVGHLVSEHIRPDLFKDVARASDADEEGEAVARAETPVSSNTGVATQ